MQIPRNINRRTLSVMVLGSLLSTACGGGDDESSLLAPQILEQPADVTAKEGEGVTFSVTLRDESSVTYQ